MGHYGIIYHDTMATVGETVTTLAKWLSVKPNGDKAWVIPQTDLSGDRVPWATYEYRIRQDGPHTVYRDGVRTWGSNISLNNPVVGD